MANQGGTHEQHVKAGQQSHKRMDNDNTRNASSTGSREQHSASSRGGTHEQHVKAGQQSHKNS
ncbi:MULTISPECIES: hypothetical protein [Rhizobium]|uniref:Stress-induced protein n=1 Tax=Rhizobium dioscoreae TaxID=2653122 RepID=A0ABQ0Z5R9_9HYPH|nr:MULTISPECIES: hypothetical protein [Rhizobium]MCZ3379582.1 hypothetical protein [Rhizobium sp. AG207R]OED00106.1 hypothetical protein A9Z06_14865 [Rhizobium sp. YK2]QYA13283.1 hypothetical protein J5284_03310 [Rhizobium sp. AB2/73]TWB16421.1 hypothetical protein FBZ99_103798 [Rhizobium sp. ERR1071]TWB48033.1 hypothetical protein FBZ98_109175 [Rhizobium sp. ERR 922]